LLSICISPKTDALSALLNHGPPKARRRTLCLLRQTATKELRGTPDSLPQTPVSNSLMKQGDALEWYENLQPGDIVLLLQLHHTLFALKRLTAAVADEFPGPKYIVPPEWGRLPLLFTLDGWEEYRPSAKRKPWWRIW
jgi:hypothetical protein